MRFSLRAVFSWYCSGFSCINNFFSSNFSKSKEELISVPPYEGLKSFVEWIKEQKTKHQAETVILIAHGELDAPCLLNNLQHYNLSEEFMKIVNGFGDTLPLIQNKLGESY